MHARNLLQLRKAREDARLTSARAAAVSMPPTDCGSGMLPMLLCEASGLQILQLIVLTLIVAYGLFMLVVRRRKRLLAAEPMGAPSTLSGAPIAQPPNALPKKKDKKAKGEKTALATSGASAGGTAVRASSATHESGSHRDAFLASGSATGWTGDKHALPDARVLQEKGRS